jgi:lipoate-protein ligase A
VPLGWCFLDAPVPGDLIQNGQKVAGAAQRRSRQGLLHQGQLAVTGIDWPRFAQHLAATVITFRPGAPEEDAAMRLAQETYGSPAWFTRR